MNHAEHTKFALAWLRQQTSEVVLFYSGGKDSIVLLDLLSPLFEKVTCVFMYFLEGLDHYQPAINHVSNYPNASVLQYPHWMTAYYLRHGFMAFHQQRRPVPDIKMQDIVAAARNRSGCQWAVFGHKEADSLNRRIMLRNLRFSCINEKQHKIYPLSSWNKKQILDYISNKRLQRPVEYGIQNSNGVDLTEKSLVFIRERYPDDLKKILKVFPLAGKILYEYDNRELTSAPEV